MSVSEPDWTATYRSSVYAFMRERSWFRFHLDGAAPPPRLDRSVTLITAWNPGSVEKPRSWNDAAQARLLRRVVACDIPWGPAWGASLPGVKPAWREEGFALHGLECAEAARWGREWGQRAIVHLSAAGVWLVYCEDERRISCGLGLLAR